MSTIANVILNKKAEGKKCLAVYLTAGYPNKESFKKLLSDVIEAGADIIELGIPFSDPLADGTVIQQSSTKALENGVTLNDVFEYSSYIKKEHAVPVVLMGYANPVLRYGREKFFAEATVAGADGIIIPDVPIDEYDNFYTQSINQDIILLTTPTSEEERIESIDEKSSGFVYCVSVTGTTGTRNLNNEKILSNLARTYKIVKKNPMMIGFGISTEKDLEVLAPYCDGYIVGSAVIKAIKENGDFTEAVALVNRLSQKANSW